MKLFNKKYPKVVEEIHNEFFLASVNLLKEAECILKKSENESLKKGNRLLDIGFGETKEAKETSKLNAELSIKAKARDYILKYQNKYPLWRFIDGNHVNEICDKYNLVCGEIGQFKGFVPNMNLKEIEQFNEIKNEDKIYDIWSIGVVNEYIGQRLFDNGESANQWKSLYKKEKIEQGLMICAPLKDMKVDEDKYERIKNLITRKLEAPDPIVLKPIIGGYLIVTAWGDEASDPDVINPINN